MLDWLVKHEIINYSIPENKYFVFNKDSQWLLMLPWQKDGSNNQ